MVWLHLALVVGLIGVLAAAMRRLHAVSAHSNPEIDVGPVSQRWLAEQRGSRKDRQS